MNLFSLYRLALFGLTLFEVAVFLRKVFRYKKYFDKLPRSVRQFLQKRSSRFILGRTKVHRRDLIINGCLIGLLLILNFLLINFS